MRSTPLILLLLCNVLSDLSAQSDFHGILEYETKTIYKSEQLRQELIEKTRKVSEMMGFDGHLLRQIESAGSHTQYLIKGDSLLAVSALLEDSLPHRMEVQMKFWAWLVDADTKTGNLLSEDAVDQMLEQHLQADWRDHIKVSHLFNTDYSLAIRHKKEKMTLLGYECTLYELPERTGTAVNFLWIAESLRPAKSQLLPYFFDPIFTPYGVVFKKTQIHSHGESVKTLIKIESKTVESFADQLNALSLNLAK